MKTFLKEGAGNFFSEVEKYIRENDDMGMLHYATENTLASLFFAGNLRRNDTLTGLQEYGIFYSKNGKDVKGQPDIFMKSGDKAIWIECKYDKDMLPLGDDHWDIPGWLKWDQEKPLQQVKLYYDSEASKLNSTYSQRFLVTLCFKLIEEKKDSHFELVQEKLETQKGNDFERGWYYQVGFFTGLDDKGKSLGLEVYGTCSDDLSNDNKLI